ncbi:hypothetical protein HUK48_07370 [Prevotella corporis]|uniref:hypothetical protein n=1 Tax=Prevotella corporis TaxID=28128 RepID=UPI0012B565D0|nr:hypothetical protein [Prevotella corporis]MDQ7737216.1 hypothetical protein [Prevotella corporis]
MIAIPMLSWWWSFVHNRPLGSHSVADVALMPFISASAAYRELPRWGMLDEKAIQP